MLCCTVWCGSYGDDGCVIVSIFVVVVMVVGIVSGIEIKMTMTTMIVECFKSLIK